MSARMYAELEPRSFASVFQLVKTSSIMRVVMSSSPDQSENFLIFHISYLLLSDYRGMAKWFRRSALVQQLSVRKDPRP